MAIDIPESGREAVAKLLRATPEFLQALYEALRTLRPSLLRRPLVDELATKLGSVEGAEKDTLRSIMDMLTGALSWRSDEETPSVLAAYIIDVAQASEDEQLRADSAAWERVRSFLEKAFTLDQLAISAKASLLFSQTPRHMHDARVLTDARPIFTKSVMEGPTGFVVVHTLQVEYWENGQEREWFLALDSDDLVTLRDAMNRAIEKERSLISTLRKTDTPVLPYKEDSSGKL